MAIDDNNKDRKEQDDFFGDDDDFGLPELDYEALDDDDDVSDDFEKDMEAEMGEFSVDDTSDFDDSSVFESDLIDENDIPDQVSDKELEAEDTSSFNIDEVEAEQPQAKTEEVQKTVDDISDEDLGEFYEEESFDDFETSEIEDLGDIDDSNFDSEDFAQFEQELLEGEDGGLSEEAPAFQSDDSHSSVANKGKFTKIVIFGLLIFVALGILFWFLSPMMSGSEGKNDKVVAEKTSEKRKPQKESDQEQEKNSSEKATEENSSSSDVAVAGDANGKNSTPKENPPTTEAKPIKTAKQESNSFESTNDNTSERTPIASNPGTINKLSGRTGNFFIVIASFVDEDMASDYAKKLSDSGKSPSIIPPFGKAITHRVALAGYGSLAEAQNNIDGLKGEYGQDIWILKY